MSFSPFEPSREVLGPFRVPRLSIFEPRGAEKMTEYEILGIKDGFQERN